VQLASKGPQVKRVLRVYRGAPESLVSQGQPDLKVLQGQPDLRALKDHKAVLD
jgi:hypothetical protein